MATNNKHKKWTKDEEAAIVKAVSRKPENLHYAFYLVSKKLNRTPETIKVHYYTVIKPYYQEHPEEAPFHLIGKTKDNPTIKTISKKRKYLEDYQVKLKKPFKVRFKEALRTLFSE